MEIDIKKRILRKQWIVDKKFQFAVVRFILLLGLAMNFVFFAACFIFFARLHSQAMTLHLPPNHVFFEFIHEQIRVMSVLVAIGALVVITISSLAGLYLSNRIAGPLYRIRLQLAELAKGSTITEIKTREVDYFQDLVSSINRVLLKK